MEKIILMTLVLAFAVANTDTHAKYRSEQGGSYDIATNPMQYNVFYNVERTISKAFDHAKRSKAYNNLYKGTFGRITLFKISKLLHDEYLFVETDSKGMPKNNCMCLYATPEQISVGMFKNGVWESYRAYKTVGGEIFINNTSSMKNYYVDGISYTNGNGYLGEVVNKKPDGYEIFVWANGDAWYGTWENGKRKGAGVFVGYKGGVKYGTWDVDYVY